MPDGILLPELKRLADLYHDTQVIDERTARVHQALVGVVALVAVRTGCALTGHPRVS